MSSRRHPMANTSPRRKATRTGGHKGPGNGLGMRLRQGREQAGMSLRGLARDVGVSPSLVSQIEHGIVTPSVGTLYAIANALGLVVDDLFRDAGKAKRPMRRNGALAAKGPVQRARERKTILLSGGVRWERLTPTADAAVEFLHVVYDVGATSCADDALIRHGGMEYAVILSGRLGIRVGSADYELSAGDSITFDAQNPHRLWTIGTEPAEAVWVVLNRHDDARRQART
jgi:transcriptional regulator with XRE-family HTH domain